GDPQKKPQPPRLLPAGQSALALGPLGQRLAAVLAFQEAGRAFEVPVQHPDEILAPAQTLAQHPRHGGLALDRRQSLPVQAELEYPPFAPAAAPGEPYLAAAGSPQLPFQLELFASGHRPTGLQA